MILIGKIIAGLRNSWTCRNVGLNQGFFIISFCFYWTRCMEQRKINCNSYAIIGSWQASNLSSLRLKMFFSTPRKHQKNFANICNSLVVSSRHIFIAFFFFFHPIRHKRRHKTFHIKKLNITCKSQTSNLKDKIWICLYK